MEFFYKELGIKKKRDFDREMGISAQIDGDTDREMEILTEIRILKDKCGY